jgi:hypothetical protein
VPTTTPPGLGLGQTLQDVTASRTLGTVYQNTTGKPIMVVTDGSIGCAHYLDTNVTCTTAIFLSAYGGHGIIIVPHGWYYKVGSGTQNPSKWMELR